MSPSTDYRDKIEALRNDLVITGRAIEATRTDYQLNSLNQEKAVAIGYQLMAYETALPTLDELNSELAEQTDSSRRAIVDAVQATRQWTNTAIGTGLVTGLLLLINLNLPTPWWLIGLDVLLMIACLLSIVAATTNSVQRPDTGNFGHLLTRITAIEDACDGCLDSEGLTMVKLLLEPGTVKPDRDRGLRLWTDNNGSVS